MIFQHHQCHNSWMYQNLWSKKKNLNFLSLWYIFSAQISSPFDSGLISIIFIGKKKFYWQKTVLCFSSKGSHFDIIYDWWNQNSFHSLITTQTMWIQGTTKEKRIGHLGILSMNSKFEINSFLYLPHPYRETYQRISPEHFSMGKSMRETTLK